MPNDSFVTMFYAVFDSHTRELHYTQAGHPPAYVIRAETSEIESLNNRNPLAGIFSHQEVNYSEGTCHMAPGDKLILYTDAITDALDSSNQHLKSMDLPTILAQHSDTPLPELFEIIHKVGQKVMGTKSYNDDFTLLGLKVLG